MISTRPMNKQKISHQPTLTRRLNTEPDQPKPLYHNLKSTQRVASKSKYIDVVSKIQFKPSAVNPNRTYKLNPYKQTISINKILKTQPDQGSKNRKNTSNSISSHSILPENKYQIVGTAGKGTFGVVYFGKVKETGSKIAIKKVLQDKRYKNRQLQIMKILRHTNILQMKDHFMSTEGNNQYLNVVMDYYPENLYQFIKKKQMTIMHIKLYMYQMLRGLNYLNSLSIAHRDIKPHNILVDRANNKVVICDFGSAKQLVKGQANLAYICSRCYRAPQLIFGATDYTPQIDMWSLGCVLVQMINGQPPFIGDSQMDQLIQIIKVLGTPSWEDVSQMNPKYSKTQYSKFPFVKSTEWKNSLRTKDEKLIDLVTGILTYSPIKRLNCVSAMLHPFFDDLRNENCYQEIEKKVKIPQLFNFSKQQMQSFGIYQQAILPPWTNKNIHGIANLKSTQQTLSSKNVVSIKKKIIQKIG